MSETPKQNEELAKSITGFMDKYGAKLFSGINTIYKKASDETRLNWRLGYENYLEKSLNKYYYAKTFLSYNEPLPLYDLYVPLSVACGETIVEKTSIIDLMSANNFSIIMATGGSGKTMMMRHLFVDTINKTSQVPIFVELRELNDSELDLFGLIKKKLRDNKFDFGDDYIEKAFQAGHFVFLLDGFDEVADAKRNDTIKQIEEIADKYEKNYIIISSRPDDSLHRWTLFNAWKVESLNVDLACELVEKTEVDEEVKGKFIIALKEDLFEKHESFLSNPLLLSIMLITYKDSANIPEKLSTFYERAYTTLFEQHDARKSFHREKHSKLDILDFKKVFSTFCFLTYNKNLYSFSETKALEYLDKVQKTTEITFEKKDFLNDCIQAVCLLLRDGLDITFSHRSFQEYFAAVFISQIKNIRVQHKVLTLLLNNSTLLLNNSASKIEIISLLFEIFPEVIEKNLIITKIEELEEIIKFDKHITNETYELLLDFFCNDVYKNEIFIDLFVLIDAYYIRTEMFGKSSSHAFLVGFNSGLLAKLRETNKKDRQKFAKLSYVTRYLLSKEFIQKVFDLNSLLVEKHKNRDLFLEEELFE